MIEKYALIMSSILSSLITVCIILLGSCSDTTPAEAQEILDREANTLILTDPVDGKSYNYEIMEGSDGCEYIVNFGGYWSSMSHSGTCPNPIHCQNQ